VALFRGDEIDSPRLHAHCVLRHRFLRVGVLTNNYWCWSQ
jgi:hypothetical protein